MKVVLGGSLVIVGLLAAVGGTSGIFTKPLIGGISMLQVGGAVVTLLGVAVLIGIDPLNLKSDVSGASVI
jgi:hypothetical protein|tara:strand:- start:8313 stop:8522 length:210 start_codon:yes stop_codon:yes gene_type:complete